MTKNQPTHTNREIAPRRLIMPRFDPTEFGRLLARLNPQELRKVEGLVADARMKRLDAE